MATDSVTVSPTFNGDSVSLTAGMIVRLAGANNNVVRAQADSSPHVQGVNGVVVSGAAAPGTAILVVCIGRQTVQMESSLVPAVGDTVYVSPTTPGKGTNVQPGIVAAIGSIADISNYVQLGTVEVDVAIGDQGTAGAQGPAGAQGSTGATGAQGAMGVQGPAGTQGPSGGAQGAQGADGAQGAQGSSVGVSSWAGATNSGLTPATPTTGDVLANQFTAAQWPLGTANRRVFLVDGVNGNDANPGYLDGGSAVFPISAPTVASTAKKTIGALDMVFPRLGEGRAVEVIIASGTYTDGLDKFLAGTTGWGSSYPVVRGTATNATAGSTAFAGDIADATYCGGVTATGMNAAGYNPTGTPTTTSVQCLKVGGAGPAFPAEPAKPLGVRMRFDSATATAALRNVCRGVAQVVGTDTLVPLQAWPAVPTAADVFYLEQAGVVVAATSLGGNNLVPTTESQLVGIASTSGTFRISDGRWVLAFCDLTAFTGTNLGSLILQFGYTHPTLGFLTIGNTLRTSGGFTTTFCRHSIDGLVCAGKISISSPVTLLALSPVTAGAGWTNAAFGMIGQSVSIGNTVAMTVPCRVLAPEAEAGMRLSTGFLRRYNFRSPARGPSRR